MRLWFRLGSLHLGIKIQVTWFSDTKLLHFPSKAVLSMWSWKFRSYTLFMMNQSLGVPIQKKLITVADLKEKECTVKHITMHFLFLFLQTLFFWGGGRGRGEGEADSVHVLLFDFLNLYCTKMKNKWWKCKEAKHETLDSNRKQHTSRDWNPLLHAPNRVTHVGLAVPLPSFVPGRSGAASACGAVAQC